MQGKYAALLALPNLAEMCCLMCVTRLQSDSSISHLCVKINIQQAPRTWLASRAGLPAPVLSPPQYACALPPSGMFGRLLGRTECHHASNQWTPRRSQYFSHSRSQSFHQHPVIPCIYLSGLHHLRSCLFIVVYMANPIGPQSLQLLRFCRPPHLHSWQSACRMKCLVSSFFLEKNRAG